MSAEQPNLYPRAEEASAHPNTSVDADGINLSINPSVNASVAENNNTMDSKYKVVVNNDKTMSVDVDPSQWEEDYMPREPNHSPSPPPLAEEDSPVSLKTNLLSMWYLVVIVITPIIMLPIILCVSDEFQDEARCGYVIAVMAVYWTTEVLPIAVTSLLPVVLFPLLGVMKARDTSAAYFNDTSMLFVGGLLVAIAIEVWDVHKRIALLTLKIVGAEPKCLLLGMTIVTWFLSMWISNTATTAMMMTIVQALLTQFREVYRLRGQSQRNNTRLNRLDNGPDDSDGNPTMSKQMEKEFLQLSKALSLTVAYSANIGGVASLTGTGPNLVLVSQARKVFEDRGLDSPINFSTWLMFGLPLSLIVVVIQWAWIVLFFLRCRGAWPCCCTRSSSSDEGTKMVSNVIDREYKKLGPVSYAQKTIFVAFFILVALWISRDLGGSGGWGSIFPAKMVSDSTPSILFGVLMFVLPSTFPASALFKNRRTSLKRIRPLLTWKHVHEKMPWTLYLLLGGGYAIAKASTESGLSKWLGDQLLVFRELNSWLILLIICYIVAFATEVTSNTAMATLMMPILAQLSISLQVNPLFYMLPAAIATSFAFMLPVATPPNAIVFASGIVRVVDMVTCGFFLNIVGVPVIVLATYTWGNAYFDFDNVPKEFLANVTTTI